MAEMAPMRDHWWWRPGWSVGRSFYTWHVTFAELSGAARLVTAYAPMFANLPTIDPVPLRWLHLTMQGVGFSDEIDQADLDRIISSAQKRCAELEPITVTIGPAHVDPETIQMPVTPVAALTVLRQAIRDAIGDVWGRDEVPEPAEGYRPHVSLGYNNVAGPAEPIAAVLASQGVHTAEVTVNAIDLIELNRDKRAYEWREVCSVPFG